MLYDLMKSEGMDMYMFDNDAKEMVKAPSLVDLCVLTAIDNVRYIGDVGGTDAHLLERILPHCKVEELKHIEDSTEGRDLSAVTDNLWKKFYENQFGANNTSLVIDRMKRKGITFGWRKLYEAKLKDLEQAQEKSFERIKQLYEKEDARKQSRQVQLCTKVPPSSNKRNFFGGWGPGSSIGNSKMSLMEKSRADFQSSQEVAMRRNAVQKSHSPVFIKKPGGATSQSIKPVKRRC